jgi:hypothetical protein
MTRKPYLGSNNLAQSDDKTLPWLKQLAANSFVRCAAVQELAGGWKDDPETLPWLKQWLNLMIILAVRQVQQSKN